MCDQELGTLVHGAKSLKGFSDERIVIRFKL